MGEVFGRAEKIDHETDINIAAGYWIAVAR